MISLSQIRRALPGGWAVRLVVLALVAGMAIAGLFLLLTGRTIFDVLLENRRLTQALTHLTAESQIGYAKVLAREERDGVTWTRLRFVETQRDDPRRLVTQHEVELPGDTIHFDALIVSFEPRLVMDGKARALYLWRRVYSDAMPPEAGFPLAEPGAEPRRYAGLLARLPRRDQRLFWREVWSLANDPDRLRQAGVRAVYGNVVYTRMETGLIYVFKIDNSGKLYPEVVPDL
jgi:hypothetical protein